MGERRRWGCVFLVAGLVAMSAPLVLYADMWVGLAVVAASCPLAIYAGYRIWRASHPAGSVRIEIARRVVAATSVLATGVAFALFSAYPLIFVGAFAVILTLGMLVAYIVARTERDVRTRQ